ncbi:hypothetical protein BRARA_G00478 [Brassica rapa]|uniref:non-specific serine/threonine protein kinase n=1 Tax=Brassica campestris TaxID=3711 RepID=A0A397YI41_BRACM|nr:hypothetical protein BRARA_G00478 [Brassica rapa]
MVTASPSLHPDEVEALKDIASTLGVKHLNLSEDPCLTKTLVITQYVLKEGQNSTIRCDCRFNNNNTCHITHFIIKTFSLPGRLPPELSKLQYLELITVCANRLSGGIPKGLGKFINLTKLDLEANQFSGTIPIELGNLVNLEGFRFSDNRLNGSIPELMGTLAKLQRLELYATGLTEPIPDSIFQLENLFDLRISDTTLGQFPHITTKNLKYLVLRNMNLTGPIPTTIWDLPYLMTLDLSFNRLTGEIPADATAPKYTYLAGNMLSGKVESGPFLTASTNIDLSYNNFTWSPSCRERTIRLLPCSAINQCKNYSRSLHINCGGPNVTIENSRGRFLYEGDNSGLTGSAMNYHGKKWGFSNTGDFMDDIITEDTYTVFSDSVVSAKYPELYQTARLSPLSLAYFAFCFENGSYNVKLHFAEIQFSDEEPYVRLAKRFFNIYVQGRSGLKLEWGTRQKICVGIARGLAFLHEDSAVKIIHRDIKGTNVLLDKDLNSKISDFGLARLHEDEKSHITTKVAGTIGYMAPEYVMRGHLTEKADVYSFGVVAMEIVSGKSNANYTPDNECCIGLHDWVLNQYFPTRICVACLTRFLIFQFQAFVLQKKGAFSEILDPKLEGLYDVMEAERMIKVSLLCSNKSPTLRPTMSEVVKMLEGETEIEQIISDPGVYGDELRFKRSSEIGTSSLPSDYLVSIPLSCHL